MIPHSLREYVLKQYHDHEYAAHMSRDKMINIFKKWFYWNGMIADIKKWIRACVKCNQQKYHQPRNHGKLISIQTKAPFDMVSADICGPIKTTTNGNKYILVIMDMFTNWIEAAKIIVSGRAGKNVFQADH